MLQLSRNLDTDGEFIRRQPVEPSTGQRRMSKDYEGLSQTSEVFILVVMIRLMGSSW